MNIDLAIQIFLLFFLIMGLIRGFYDQLYGFFAGIASIATAYYATPIFFQHEDSRDFWPYLIIGLGCFMVLKIIGAVFRKKFLKTPMTRIGDHVLGLLLGLGKGFLVITSVYYLCLVIPMRLGGIPERFQKEFESSYFYKNILGQEFFSQSHFEGTVSIVPRRIHQSIRNRFSRSKTADFNSTG